MPRRSRRLAGLEAGGADGDDEPRTPPKARRKMRALASAAAKEEEVEELTRGAPPLEAPGRACAWALRDERSRQYHDLHWGHPIRCPRKLFEILSLCAQQAGVSWRVVWNKREAYAKAFKEWDLRAVAAMDDADVDAMIADPQSGVMRNRKKLAAIVNNAKHCLELDNTFEGGLAGFLWSFTDGAPLKNEHVWGAGAQQPTESATSKAMAADLRARGFKFLGSITLHSFCEQVGILNNHCASCRFNSSDAGA